MKATGRIIKIVSNQFTVKVNEREFICSARGKFRNQKMSPVVGDIVEIDSDEKIIEKINSRKNYLDRPIVANVDIALILTSVKKPNLSLYLLDKLLSVVIYHKIEPIICFSKLDLLNKDEIKKIKSLKKYYESIGIKVVTNKDKNKILRLIKGKVAVVTGQTGAGKSSLLNRLDKKLQLETKPISEALNRGVHTTRHVELYEIRKAFIVDTPGFSALDLKEMSIEDLKNTFNEFKGVNCGYDNCNHHKEKNCGVKELVKDNKILSSRYENYLSFLGEVNENNSKLYK